MLLMIGSSRLSVQHFVDEAVEVYQDMHHAVTQRWHNFLEATGVYAEKARKIKEEVAGVHKLDLIKESVAQLSGKVADTWEKVRGCVCVCVCVCARARAS